MVVLYVTGRRIGYFAARLEPIAAILWHVIGEVVAILSAVKFDAFSPSIFRPFLAGFFFSFATVCEGGMILHDALI